MEQLKPKNIVCFALPAWEADYLRSTVELMKGVAVNNLVLYIDYAYTVSDLIKGVLGKKKFDWKRLIGLKKRLRRISGDDGTGLFVLSLPPVFPSFIIKSASFFKMANRFNAAITGYFINRAIKKLQMQDIIGFNSFQPFLGNYWKIINLKFNVYYIYDDFSNVPFFQGFAAIEESKFIAKVDLVIVSSDELKKRKCQIINKPIEVVNNGVHFNSFFNNIKSRKLNDGYMKTVGYTGTMDNRIDIDLLENVITKMPGVRFLFIGKVREQYIYDRLLKYINVCFEPPVSTEKIPYMQRQIDVGIIPYVCNELTAAIYPLKANEYLAMGLPVVVTPFASLGEADDVVYVAAHAGAFVNSLKIALNENDELLKQHRLAIARKADWKERSNQLMDLIDKYSAGEQAVLEETLIKIF
ncbi:MAG: glycosyltransferase [Bacteroidota bacterium]|nr:glycosyltransferase [Bacteroidota bacterium]